MHHFTSLLNKVETCYNSCVYFHTYLCKKVLTSNYVPTRQECCRRELLSKGKYRTLLYYALACNAHYGIIKYTFYFDLDLRWLHALTLYLVLFAYFTDWSLSLALILIATRNQLIVVMFDT